MPTKLTTDANEESTYVINVAFTDEDGTAVVPDSVEWSLHDEDGDVINSKSAQSETPASNIDITLSGDDLSIQSGETRQYKARRKVTVEAVVDLANGVNNQPLIDVAEFDVINLAYIT